MKNSKDEIITDAKKRARIMARREYKGPVFFSGAFRPFFLGAALWAVIAIGLWLIALYDGQGVAISPSWHIHEMIFGFAGAAVAGFILTAVPNWTGRLPVRGWPLAGLTGLWLLGRFGMVAEGFFGLAKFGYLDLLFLPVLALVVGREIIAGKNKRNLVVVGLIGLLALANLLTHFGQDGITGGMGWGWGWRLGLAALIMLLSLIGGRVTPSFTRNYLARLGEKNLPKQPSRLDKISLLLNLIALLAWVGLPNSIPSGVLLTLAGIGQLIRLSRWRGLSCLRESIVFVLHVGFGWIGLGLIVLGVSILTAIIPASDAIHALTIGAVGTMITAVSSRASLGHTGRLIRAGRLLSSVYILISLAAVLRILSGFVPMFDLILPAGLVWMSGFVIFIIIFTAIYFSPRLPRQGR